MTEQKEKKPSKTTLRTSARYLARMERGERIIRDSAGKIQWSDGRRVGAKTIEYMMAKRIIGPLDTDLFGDPSRGQTIGLICDITEINSCGEGEYHE